VKNGLMHPQALTSRAVNSHLEPNPAHIESTTATPLVARVWAQEEKGWVTCVLRADACAFHSPVGRTAPSFWLAERVHRGTPC
jgi:hypothetical protein